MNQLKVWMAVDGSNRSERRVELAGLPISPGWAANPQMPYWIAFGNGAGE
jgi:hypothetical protein